MIPIPYVVDPDCIRRLPSAHVFGSRRVLGVKRHADLNASHFASRERICGLLTTQSGLDRTGLRQGLEAVARRRASHSGGLARPDHRWIDAVSVVDAHSLYAHCDFEPPPD